MKDQLTNEKLKGLFKSNFELAKYAIRLGRYYIKSGRELNVDELLEEIRKHPDEKHLNDLQEWDAREKEEEDAGRE